MADPVTNPSGCCGVEVECCDEPVPDSLVMTLSNVEDCACIDGITIPLIWDDWDFRWEGTGPGGGDCELQDEIWALSCDGTGKFALAMIGSTPCSSTPVLESSQCDPLNLTFSLDLVGLGCCDSPYGTGKVEITVTE